MKLPNYLKDDRAKYYFKRILKLMPSPQPCDELIIVELAQSLAIKERAMNDVLREGYILETSTTRKTHPALDLIKTQQLNIRSSLQQLKLTPSTRGGEPETEVDAEVLNLLGAI